MSDGGRSERRFLLDVMLGKLATFLRMCGHDTAYALDRGIEADERILRLATAENRTLLTRDEQLAAQADDAILLTERDVEDQLRELRAAGVDLSLPARPRRCSNCNGELAPADADEAPAYVPDDTETYRCRDCGQWFWRGSHWADVRETLAAL
ncbi:hypothetical protein SAMN05216277_105211 [Halolamina pelagica]|uniref:Mut7-C RNAse domain-containing protein n=1 Tax=Halolamina pelagica TaxID=699431 RepID=A0A1I5RYX6_9EURY|nr:MULTISPECIES: Mut7-C RNAse domain-containing protein [Halolamina]SFP63660.1 hypothetical protein SAMN05216277_105211 [Halolamina pelagica]